MPTSAAALDSEVISWLFDLQPESVLDLGMGFGKWGFLCRYVLDALPGRWHRQSWQVRLDGVEGYSPYVQGHQRQLYDRIYEEDIAAVLGRLDATEYALVILGDVLEHFERERAWWVLHRCLDVAQRALLVKIPLGPGWGRAGTEDNDLEAHLSEWEEADFMPYRPLHVTTTLQNGLGYGAFLFEPTRARQGLLATIVARRLEAKNSEAAELLARLRLFAGRGSERLLSVAEHLTYRASRAELARVQPELAAEL